MNRNVCILRAAAFVGTLGLLSGAFAADSVKSEVSGYGGGASLSDGGGTHGIAGGTAGVNVSEKLHVFADVNYVPLGKSSFAYGGSGVSSSAKLINFGGGVSSAFMSQGSKVSPYVLGVFGVGRASAKVSVTVAGQSTSEGASDTNPYLGGGVGLRYMVGENWGVRPEVRYQRYLTDGGGHVLMFTAGVFFQFGR
jgi:opacity protein-like surface antigen